MPDLPMLRNSERSTFKKCGFLWDISYNRRLSPSVSAPPLRFGTLIHASLASYYKVGVRRGPNPVATFEKLYEEDLKEAEAFGWRDEDGSWHDAGELGVSMLTGYLNEYGADDVWKVVVTEQPYRVVVLHPDTGKPWFAQTGVLDGIWSRRDKEHNVVVDHKTAGTINTRYLVMDDQAGSYWTWGVDYALQQKLLGTRMKLDGMMFNFLRKSLDDPRPCNAEGHYLNQPTAKEKKEFGEDYPGSVSKKQPPPRYLRHYTFRDEYDRAMQRERAMGEYRHIEMIRAGELPIHKSPGAMTCGGCWLLDACELHETGNDWEGFLRQTSKTWEPYEAQEIAMGR